MILWIVLLVVLLLVVSIIVFVNGPQFGKRPTKQEHAAWALFPHFQKGVFHNINRTPALSDGYSMRKVATDFIFKKFPGATPSIEIPHVKTDLHALDAQNNLIVWFGHSSYYFQLSGIRFLVDPVFSGNASPIPGSNRSFKGSDIYGVQDIPAIDYLLITHDHYDHLDYTTVRDLRSKVKQVICGLGVGGHLFRWGYTASQVQEMKWQDSLQLDASLQITSLPARHFSGRSFTRNNTLWQSFALISSDFKLFIGGDSGYDAHFKKIGEQFNGFDLAILENGQYNDAWHEIHLHPHEVVQAALDLNTKQVLAVHNCKFKLAFHVWSEPLVKVKAFIDQQPSLQLLTPRIGEVMPLQKEVPTFHAWWEPLLARGATNVSDSVS